MSPLTSVTPPPPPYPPFPPVPGPIPYPLPPTWFEFWLCKRGGVFLATDSSSIAGYVTKNSVDLLSGQFVFEKPLVSIDAPGVGGWAFGISYRSEVGVYGLLGPGFNYTQHARLIEGPEGDVLLENSQTSREVFMLDDSSSSSSGGGVLKYLSENNNSGCTLTREGEGLNDEFTLVSSEATVTKFYGFNEEIVAPGRIKSITDSNGNYQKFSWTATAGNPQMTSVEDTYGRIINYSYYGTTSGYYLKEIEDYLG